MIGIAHKEFFLAGADRSAPANAMPFSTKSPMSTNPNQVTPAIDLLQKAGWKITLAEHPISLDEGRVKANYASLPRDYTDFLEQIQERASPPSLP